MLHPKHDRLWIDPRDCIISQSSCLPFSVSINVSNLLLFLFCDDFLPLEKQSLSAARDPWYKIRILSFLLYSTLASPPFCLLEPLSTEPISDYRMCRGSDFPSLLFHSHTHIHTLVVLLLTLTASLIVAYYSIAPSLICSFPLWSIRVLLFRLGCRRNPLSSGLVSVYFMCLLFSSSSSSFFFFLLYC